MKKITAFVLLFSLATAGVTAADIARFYAYDDPTLKLFKCELELPLPEVLPLSGGDAAPAMSSFRLKLTDYPAEPVEIAFSINPGAPTATEPPGDGTRKPLSGNRYSGQIWLPADPKEPTIVWLQLDRIAMLRLAIPGRYERKHELIRVFCSKLEETRLRCMVAIGDAYTMLQPKPYTELFLAVDEARRLVQMRRYASAADSASAAIKLKKNCLGAYYYRGQANAGMQEYEKALQDYKQIIALDSGAAWAYLRLMELVLLAGYRDQFDPWQARLDAKTANRPLTPELQVIKLYLNAAHDLINNRATVDTDDILKQWRQLSSPPQWNFQLLRDWAERAPLTPEQRTKIIRLTDEMKKTE